MANQNYLTLSSKNDELLDTVEELGAEGLLQFRQTLSFIRANNVVQTGHPGKTHARVDA